MELSLALEIKDKDVVAFVGGGGKTSAMFRLAHELVAQGKCVVTTTTTRIFAAQIKLAPQSLRLEEGVLEVETARAMLAQNPHLLVIGATTDEGKALGVDANVVDALIALDEVDAVLVEADGSRMRPFKAPAEHEPVIPASTTVLVPVVGVDVVGKPLDAEHVHRAEVVAGILSAPMGTTLTPQHIARVLGDAQGGLKNRTAQSRVIPLINKVETDEQTTAARAIARELLQNHAIESVAIGTLKNDASPVRYLQSRVSAVILAAGGSTRMRGDLKQLLPWDGTTFVGNAIRVAKESQVTEIIVVTGHERERVEQAVSIFDGIRCVRNPDWASGRASSVRTGIGAINAKSSAAIFINADQPFLTADVLDTILNTFFEMGAPIVVPTYDGNTGSPVLFARELFGELSALQGEQGGRDILLKRTEALVTVEIGDERAALDLDTPEDYRAALDTTGRDAGG